MFRLLQQTSGPLQLLAYTTTSISGDKALQKLQ